MPVPLVGAAIGVAARVIAKKLATRTVGGITGSGAKQVNSVYRNIGEPKSAVKVVEQGGRLNQSRVNQGSLMKTTDAKTGAAAKKAAKKTGAVDGPNPWQKPIKISTNPMRGK